MVIAKNNSEVFYIKRLKENKKNKNKTVYIDHSKLEISFSDTLINLHFLFFVINNFNLPENTLLFSVKTSFFNIENSNLIKGNQDEIPDDVIQKDDCKVYHQDITFNIADTALMKEPMDDKKIDFNIGLDVSIEKIRQVYANEEDINDFLVEWYNSKHNLSFNYTNYYLADSNTKALEIDYGYNVYSHKNFEKKISPLYFLDNINLNNLTESFEYFVNLKGLETFLLISKTVLHYQYESTWKKIDFEDRSTANIKFGYKIKPENDTWYDFNKKELSKVVKGIKGILFPEETTGFYETNFKVKVFNSIKQINFKKEFSFADNPNFKNEILLKNTYIDDLTHFKELK